ncbi:hypothetical protein IAU60_006854 [Kwoniella sp. DSM 27419]
MPAGPRIIRAFEEVKVPVKTDEWYDELECPICSQILPSGATQSLVPCGHSFCGPCCYKWLQTNEKPTCPTCRVEVAPAPNAFVPNILVDQVIERKLGGLLDSADKRAMLIERKEKMQRWKVIQASIAPTKTVPKRPRGLPDIMSDFIDLVPGAQRNGHARRASRHLPELGPAIAQEISNTERQAEAARQRIASLQERVEDMRRLREERINFLTAQIARDREESASGLTNSNLAPRHPRVLSAVNAPDVRAASPQLPPYLNDFSALNRMGMPRSPAFARRQARGWTVTDRGTRDDPLVVLSDEEE